MRIWSLDPKYLDTKGLVALWRETLLAKNVLECKTKGYKNHPQLCRFKEHSIPLDAINYYLKLIWLEADNRNYKFDRSKFIEIDNVSKINVTIGQVNFEKAHLMKKLKLRDINKHNENIKELDYSVHPLFNVVNGEIEEWEIL